MATIAKEIWVTTENKVGSLAKALTPLKEMGVSIRAVSAWGENGKAEFLIVTEDSVKATGALKKAGYSIQEKEVVLAELQNRIGALAEATKKLGDAGIDINHCYVSASGSQALAVISTKDNAKAVKLL